jgi:DegV family protein with EDD domain
MQWIPQVGPTTNQRMRRHVRVVTDSTTDILPSYAQALGLIVVPNRIFIDQQMFLDGVTMTPTQFFLRLPQMKTLPYTAPVDPNDLFHAYQFAFDHGATDIVSIHLSSRLSQGYHNAESVKAYMAPASISLIDSQQASIGMWPAVTEAAKAAQLGGTAPQICAVAQGVLARTRVFFMVESLEFLRRSGRVGRAQAFMGNLLDARPILTVRDGEIAPQETVRQRDRAISRLVELALDQGTPEIILITASDLQRIDELETLLRTRYDGPVQKTWLGPTVGANTGPALGIAVVTR